MTATAELVRGDARPRARRRTLVDAYDPRANAITPIRLGLALLVVFSHSFVTGGFGFDPFYTLNSGQLQLGAVAVIGFFGLSGFLLSGSRETTDRLPFARNRALRIVPGLWACLIVMVLVVQPIAVALGGQAPTSAVAAWALKMGLFSPLPGDVIGMYHGITAPDWANGPLWTLPIEVFCYLALVLSGRRFLRPTALYLFLLFLGFCALDRGVSLLLHLPVAFFTGMLLYLWRDRVPVGGRWATLLVAITAVATAVGLLGVVGPVTIAALTIWLSTRARILWRRDISYGVYIYAWPIQSLVAMAGVAGLGFLPYLGVVVLILLPVALASAVLVEEPALRFRHRAGARRAVATPA